MTCNQELLKEYKEQLLNKKFASRWRRIRIIISMMELGLYVVDSDKASFRHLYFYFYPTKSDFERGSIASLMSFRHAISIINHFQKIGA